VVEGSVRIGHSDLNFQGGLQAKTNLAELDADGEVREIHQSDEIAVEETQGSGGR
jgi:hypothetical protein